MAIHKIKAKDGPSKPAAPEAKPAKAAPPPPDKNPKKSQKTIAPSTKKPFILIRPFIALARYVRDSWRELRQVLWPTRKFTWKMTLSVVIFVALFTLLIAVLDILFTLLFSNIIK